MLDRAKLLKEITRVSPYLFASYTDEYAHANRIWDRIAQDELFAQQCASQTWPSLPIPAWSGPLNAIFPLDTTNMMYTVIAVDGSQIYPDRHQGTSCYLINIGLVTLSYGMENSCAEIVTEPYVFTEYNTENFLASPIDIVNALREAYEFEAGYKQIMKITDTTIPALLLLDGSLIFWHLESKDAEFRNCFINRYIQTLNELYDNRILHAAYVSMPRHREVSNLIRLALCNFNPERSDLYALIAHVTDNTVMHFFLQPGQRSTIFAYTGNLRLLYPEAICPYFFYVNTGYEIGRIEIPAWIARTTLYCDLVASVILDQARKCQGYPIALAEAHEQAVVKGADRDFFYQVIKKYALHYKKRIEISPKSMKKRSIGI